MAAATITTSFNFDNVLLVSVVTQKQWLDAQKGVFIVAKVTVQNLLKIRLAAVRLTMDVGENSAPFVGILKGEVPNIVYNIQNLAPGASDTKSYQYGITPLDPTYHPVDSFQLDYNIVPKYTVDYAGVSSVKGPTAVVTKEVKP